jgi:protein TonB
VFFFRIVSCRFVRIFAHSDREVTMTKPAQEACLRGSSPVHAHTTPEPDGSDPKPMPDPRPPVPVPDDVPDPVNAPVEEPRFPEAPIRAV